MSDSLTHNRISVTELDSFQACAQQHHYKYIKKIKPRYGEPAMALVVGRAVANALEQRLMLGTSVEESIAGEIPFGRVRENAIRAAQGLPGWIWDVTHPVGEDRLEVDYRAGQLPSGTPSSWHHNILAVEDRESLEFNPMQIQMVGRPDFWYVKYAEESTPMNPIPVTPIGIVVVELKTSSATGAPTNLR